MKMMKTVGVMVGVLTVLTARGEEISPNRRTDILKPAFQKQEQGLLRLLDKWMADGMEYEVIADEYPISKSSMKPSPFFSHYVKLPLEIEQGLRELNFVTGYMHRFRDEQEPREVIVATRDGRRVPGLMKKYSHDPKYSFPMAVLHLAMLSSLSSQGSWMGYPLEAIVQKDKGKWNEDEINRMLERKRTRLYDYDLDIFSSYSIPVTYATEVLTSNKKPKDLDLKEKLHLCVANEKREQVSNRSELIKWSRKNKPDTNPYLSALMMGLFTVDGYAFNDETGIYTMNERGKMLMDFIVEFPIPENATRLQAVMNGGNKDEIEALMKKHKTEEKWQELLKNPIHPEFAKYPQD